MNPRELLEIPRYRDDPVYLFVEMLVVDTIEGLPQDAQEWIATVIRTEVRDWRAKIKAIATLSDTFEIAVLDLWYRNSEIAANRGELLSARDFSYLFADNYFAENSLIDVWEPGALEDARRRIAAAQTRDAKRKT